MAKEFTNQPHPIENEIHNLAGNLRQLAVVAAHDEDIDKVHYLVTESRRMSNLVNALVRRGVIPPR